MEFYPQFAHQPQTHKNGTFTFKKVFLVSCMLSLSFTLFTLASLSFAGALIGLVVAAPVLFLLSPVIVPAALVIVLAVTGFLSAGAVGLAAVTILFWIYHFLRMMLAEAESKPFWRLKN